jgi:superfamily II DNA or RNA helicase
VSSIPLLTIKSVYKTRDGSIGTSFFAPCLRMCASYRRAAGFFSSSALVDWAAPFLENECEDLHIDLLTSPKLSASDRAAFEAATTVEGRKGILTKTADELVRDLLENPNHAGPRADFLIWLIAQGKLSVQFALPEHVDDPGMYHQKSGVFTFPDGSTVAFEGSANESASGYLRNYESIHVFRSWVSGDSERLAAVAQELHEQWTGDDEFLSVVPLSPEALHLIQVRANDIDDEVFRKPKKTTTPPEDPKWRHQQLATSAFIRARRGVLEMATGTGKTKTALRISSELMNNPARIDSLIVATEGRDLLQQWYEELLEWRGSFSNPPKIYRHFGDEHQGMAFALTPSHSVLVVSRGQLGKFLPMLDEKQSSRTLVVHDEVHGLGAPFNRASLDGKHARFAYVLGLSATPEREYDQDGTAFIEREIGPTVFSFGLEDAIGRGILCEFNYVPLPYELTPNDRDRLKAVYAKQGAREKAGQPMSNEELWTELSKVYKTAEQKPGIFADYLGLNPEILNGCILFVEEREYGERILPLLHEAGVRYRTYYADDDRDNLLMFGRGEIDCVITCHKISQGIDIRSLRSVVLFSSARARLETIQRVGRCLRSDPANPDKRATVVDFVLEPDQPSAQPTADELRRDWLAAISQVRKVQDAH